MTTPKINWELNVGTFVHLVVLLAGIAIAYGQFSIKFTAAAEAIQTMQRQTARIEHYLSSQDKDYWQKVSRNGDRVDP